MWTELPQMLSCTAATVGSAGSRPIWRDTHTSESLSTLNRSIKVTLS